MANISDYFLESSAEGVTGYRTKKLNIPWYSEEDHQIRVKLLYNKFASGNAFVSALPRIRVLAINRFLLHYFPEYYTYYRTLARKKEAVYSDADPGLQTYRRIRASMLPNLSPVYFETVDPAYSDKSVVLVSFTEFSFELPKPEVEALKLKIGNTSAIYSKVQNLPLPSGIGSTPFTTESPKELKEVLLNLDLLPDADKIQQSLSLFNEDEGIAEGGAHTTLLVGSLMEDSALAKDGLAQYQEQLNGFEGSLPINLNFNDMQRGMMQILNGVVIEGVLKELTDVHNANLTVGGPYVEFTDADSITISFGTRENGDAAISAISYLVTSVSQNRKPVLMGYMTNITWNKEMNDPLILATLKNYESLVAAMALAQNFQMPSSNFMDWMKDNPGDFGADDQTIWDDFPDPAAPDDHLLLREAHRLGIIDLGDTTNLEEALIDQLTPEQLERFKKEVRDNPEIYARLRAAMAKKTVGTAVDIIEAITNVLETGNLLGGIKPDSPLGQLLRKIGIEELAKEAWICATFGLSASFARIGKAAGRATARSSPAIEGVAAGRPPVSREAMEEKFAPLKALFPPPGGPKRHGKPKPPKPAMKMPKPELPKLPTIDGDLWPNLKKVLINSLIEGVIQIVKALAELLKESCKLNNPLSDDFGATDVGELVNNNLNDDFNNTPSITNNSPLDQLFGNDNLSPGQVLGDAATAGYLSDLSAILSSMEICFLFTDRSELSVATIDRIINFNLSYHDLDVRAALNTPSAVLGFFANLARFVDVSTFCNEIANQLFQANVDNICLLEDMAPDAINEILLDMAENGVEIPNPIESLNLKCPLAADYCENALMSIAIPTLLNTAATAVETEFVNGVSAAQQILKEPTIAASDSSAAVAAGIAAAQQMGVAAPAPEEEPSKVSQDILRAMQEVFATMESILDKLDEHCDVASLLGVEAGQVEEIISTVVTLMQDLVTDQSTVLAVQDIDNRLSALSGAMSGPGGASSVATQYEFPTGFKTKFGDYLGEAPVLNPIANMGIPDFSAVMTNGQVRSEHFNAYSFYSNYDSYKPINLKFTLPRKQRISFIPSPGGEQMLTPSGVPNKFGIPKFIKAPTPQGADDHILLTFPDADTAAQGGNLADVVFKSKLFPGANDFNLTDPVSTVTNSRNTNPYVSLFSDKLISQIPHPLHNNNSTLKEMYTREIDTVLFPAVFAGQVEAMFNFIEENGIFDTEKLDSLNFFHDNSGCLPENVADLLDMGPSPPGGQGDQGGTSILDQLRQEMEDAMCNDVADPDDDNPDGTRIRDVLRFGVFQMLIQIHIAQFIIKNIFVFSAFEIDDLLEIPTVKQFMSVTLRNQIAKFISIKPLVGEWVVKYYNKKIARAPSADQGGLVDSSGNVVFRAGRSVTLADLPALIEYTTEKRIFDSRRSVSNAVKRASSKTNPKDFNRAFVEDVLTIQPSFFGAGPAGHILTNTAGRSRRYLRFRVNPAQISAGSSIHGSTWTSAMAGNQGILYSGRAKEHLDLAWNKFRGNDPATQILPYGKLVLERQVMWESVVSENNKRVPNIFRYTTGHGYGLELSIFKDLLNKGTAHPGIWAQASQELRFTNLRMAYNIVYYMPNNTGASVSMQNQPLIVENIKLHNHLKLDLGDGNVLTRFVLARLDSSLGLANDISLTDTSLQAVFNTQTAAWETLPVPILKQQLEHYQDTVTNSELTLITEDPVFQDYFDKTFNRTLTSLIPVMYNFYLTTDTFPAMDRILMGAKHRCLQIFVDATVDDSASPVDMSSRTSPQAEQVNLQNINDPAAALNASARDFILKMLIETPINILRGVSEMMDPHVGISKIIRDITGMIFDLMADQIDKSEPLRFLREGPKTEEQLAAEEAAEEQEAQAARESAAADMADESMRDAANNSPLAGIGSNEQGLPPSQVEGQPQGTILMEVPGDDTYEYARIPDGTAAYGYPRQWLMRKKSPPDSPWINISRPNPNKQKEDQLEADANPLGYDKHLASEGVEPIVGSDPSGITEYQVPGYTKSDYAKNAAGDWLGRRANRSYKVPWEKAFNYTKRNRTADIAWLEKNAVRVGGAPATPDEGLDMSAQIEAGEEQARINAEKGAISMAMLTEIDELPTDTVLRKGNPPATSNDVLILQAKLSHDPPEGLGYPLPQFGVDGDFGDETKSAVEEFQADAFPNDPSEIDGIVGPNTWGALVAALTEQAEAAAAEPVPGVGPFPNITGEKVMELMFCALGAAMEIAAAGFVLGDGKLATHGGKARDGSPLNTVGRLPAIDSDLFLGKAGLMVPGAVFLGNRLVNPDPFNGPGMIRNNLTYQEGQEDPRDPRNNVPEAIKDNLFPRISMEGVDFTGTFLGLLMLPPGPFGIVYLLLMLLKNALDEAMQDDQDESAEPMTNVSEEETPSQC
ncbi:hypothetical protein [uncultured Mediterranean phage]|nr:hypothetical protein [uncultured Mediterranean phage]